MQKSTAEVVELLNHVLTAELTAINQYFIHAMMLKDQGLPGLAEKVREESIDEMRHAQLVIERILYLDGVPNMQRYMKVVVGATVPEQLENDIALEEHAIPQLRDGIALCRSVGDIGSALLLEEILRAEERHLDWLETQRGLVQTLGLERYLVTKVREQP